MVQNQGTSDEMGEEGDEMDKQTAIDLLDNLLGMVEDNHESDYDTAIKMGIDALQSNAPNALSVLDCVERQAAINAIHEWGLIDGLSAGQAIEILSDEEKVPSVQPQRWIPVAEALPDRGKTVLITNDKGNVRSGRFRGVEFWKDDGDAYWTFKGNTVEHVLAWMPLPPVYEGGQNEDDRR